MASFTASIVELRHDQLYILIVFIKAKLNKIFNSKQKNINILIFIMIFNKSVT
jgi:hypothetical protein